MSDQPQKSHAHNGVTVTYLPPGPEDPALHFQPFQFWKEKFGSTASAHALTPETSRLVAKDPTLLPAIAGMLAEAKKKLLEEPDEERVEQLLDDVTR